MLMQIHALCCKKQSFLSFHNRMRAIMSTATMLRKYNLFISKRFLAIDTIIVEEDVRKMRHTDESILHSSITDDPKNPCTYWVA